MECPLLFVGTFVCRCTSLPIYASAPHLANLWVCWVEVLEKGSECGCSRISISIITPHYLSSHHTSLSIITSHLTLYPHTSLSIITPHSLSSHLTLYHHTSLSIITSHLTLYPHTSLSIITSHLTLYHHITPHSPSSHLTLYHHITPHSPFFPLVSPSLTSAANLAVPAAPTGVDISGSSDAGKYNCKKKEKFSKKKIFIVDEYFILLFTFSMNIFYRGRELQKRLRLRVPQRTAGRRRGTSLSTCTVAFSGGNPPPSGCRAATALAPQSAGRRRPAAFASLSDGRRVRSIRLRLCLPFAGQHGCCHCAGRQLHSGVFVFSVFVRARASRSIGGS